MYVVVSYSSFCLLGDMNCFIRFCQNDSAINEKPHREIFYASSQKQMLKMADKSSTGVRKRSW